MQDKVSVIMPVYNREKKVKNAIESVLKQTYQNFELIIINDGSTDNTEEVCLSYAKKNDKIHYVKQNNAGPAIARNKGIETATGKYIMFIDSDDLYLENTMKLMVEEIENNYQCIICNMLYDNGRINQKEIIEREMENKPEFMEYLQKNRLFNSCTNKIYITSIIKEYNIQFDSNFLNGEDYKFNIDYFDKINKAKTVSEALYIYINNSMSITHDLKNNEFFKQIKLIDYNKAMYLKNGYSLENLLRKLYYSF